MSMKCRILPVGKAGEDTLEIHWLVKWVRQRSSLPSCQFWLRAIDQLCGESNYRVMQRSDSTTLQDTQASK